MAIANSGSLAQLFSVRTSTGAASGPALQRPSGTHRFRHSPSSGLWVCASGAFLDSHSPQCLWSHVSLSCTLPSQCLWSQCTLSAHPVLRILAQYPPQPRRSFRQLGGEDTGAVAAGEFPKLPPGVLFFLRKSSCSILLLHTRKGLSSHTAHLSSWTGTVQVRALYGPTLNSPELVLTVSCVYHTSSLISSL